MLSGKFSVTRTSFNNISEIQNYILNLQYACVPTGGFPFHFSGKTTITTTTQDNSRLDCFHFKLTLTIFGGVL